MSRAPVAKPIALGILAPPLTAPSVLALLLLLVPVFVRASSGFSALPGWDQDPLTMYDPATGFGPAGSLLLDGIMLIGAAALVTLHAARSTTLLFLAFVLLVITFAGRTLWGGAVDATDALHNGRVAINWGSGALAALALAAACQDPRIRRLVLASTLAVIALFAVRAGVQVFVDHPAVVADFRARREEIFASRGWTPGSAMARTYERRLMQADASAWFALSNVLASFAAASVVAFAGLIALPWLGATRAVSAQAPKGRPSADSVPASPNALGAWLGLLASAFTLYCTQSKGGVAVVAVGMGILAAIAMFRFWQSRRRGSGKKEHSPFPLVLAIGIGCVALPIGLIVVRGLFGTELGDRSLLFRWFYLQGSANIIGGHPLLGVGPEGFQQAFMSAKPAVCPEDVTSPHSILFDYLACIGLPRGAIMGAVLIGLSVLIAAGPWMRARIARSGAGKPVSTPLGDSNKPDNFRTVTTPITKVERQTLLLIATFSTIVCAWFESAAMSPEAAIARVGGLIAWCGLSLLLLPLVGTEHRDVSGRGLAIALAPAALALIAHAQVEVTASWLMSSSLFFVWLGTLASLGIPNTSGHGGADTPTASRATEATAHPSLLTRVPLAMLPFALGGFAAFGCAWGAWKWERPLRAAAAELQTVAEFQARLRSLTASNPPRADSGAQIAREIDAATTGKPSTDAEQLTLKLARLSGERLQTAAVLLNKSLTAAPGDWRTRRALSEVELRLAFLSRDRGDLAATTLHADAALAAINLPKEMSATSGLLRAGAVVRSARIDLFDPEREDAERRASLKLFEQLAAIDPFNPDVPYQSFRIAKAMGLQTEARIFAAKAVSLQTDTVLDPLARGLTDAQIAELRAEVGQSTSPSGPAR